MITDYKIGADPEVFVKSGDVFLSAHDLIPGTKLNPFPVNDGAIQVDGVAAEFNVNPATNPDEFIKNVQSVLSQLTARITEKNPDYRLVFEPTAYFTKGYFDALPPEPKLLGCTPDYNAYTRKENEPPATDEPFRTGSGHFHIGWYDWVPTDDQHFEECVEVVRQLDAVLYPVSLLWDNDDKRRTLYGKMGAFRMKSFGVEYRPCSNRWLSSPIIMRWCFQAIQQAMVLVKEKNVRIYEDEIAGEMVNKILSGGKPSFEELQAYAFYLNKKFDIPLFVWALGGHE